MHCFTSWMLHSSYTFYQCSLEIKPPWPWHARQDELQIGLYLVIFLHLCSISRNFRYHCHSFLLLQCCFSSRHLKRVCYIGLCINRAFMNCVCTCRVVLGSCGGSSCKQARVPGQGHLSRTDTGLFRTPICTGATVPPGRRHGQSVHLLAACQAQCRPSVAGTEALDAEQSLAPSSPPVVL